MLSQKMFWQGLDKRGGMMVSVSFEVCTTGSCNKQKIPAELTPNEDEKNSIYASFLILRHIIVRMNDQYGNIGGRKDL